MARWPGLACNQKDLDLLGSSATHRLDDPRASPPPSPSLPVPKCGFCAACHLASASPLAASVLSLPASQLRLLR